MSTTTTPTTNRRRDRRRTPRASLRIKCLKGRWGLGANLAVSVLDVCESGIRFVATSALDPGQEIEVELHAAARRRACKQMADVLWCVTAADGTYCVGARFCHRLRYSDLQDFCS
jgi:hypothetical protein